MQYSDYYLQTAVLVDVVEDLHEHGAGGFAEWYDLQVPIVLRNVRLAEVVLDSSLEVITPLAEKHLLMHRGHLNSYYRPQRSWAKVMFLQASVILLTGGVCLSACWDTTTTTPRSRHPPGTRHPPGPDTPRDQTLPPKEQTPPGADPPGTRPPPRADPPGADTPPGTRPPPLGSRLWDTVNERPVRILLECILVMFSEASARVKCAKYRLFSNCSRSISIVKLNLPYGSGNGDPLRRK